ncbi:MAG: glycerol-3-phosphate 1-O-acyltransferase PlsY [Gammaproteobacteria bacterium]|nr:glycerol-3-phosphate 1-O-acyltransferase PlsY [Gammaproteobacteria bacterium]
MMISISLVVFAYLLGSVSSAILVCRAMGLPDPRTEGSKNPGATNVLRIGSKKTAAIALLGDMAKGLLPMLLAHWLGASNTILALVMLAAFLGHLYPLYFGFKGGKGVATALGVLTGLYGWVGLATITTWLLMTLLFRISSLSALVASVASPFYVWWFRPEPELMAASIVIALMLLWRHRSNIQRLLSGKEIAIKS